MEITPIQTRLLVPPKDDLHAALIESLPPLRDGDILCVTSKVLAIHQGRCVPMGSVSKQALVESEADAWLPDSRLQDRFLALTIKGGVLIPNAGIDASKLHGFYILWPEHVTELLEQLWHYVTTTYGLQQFGLIATDTRSTPLRFGFTGVAMGSYGFDPLYSYGGRADAFGNPIQSTVNLVDSLAAAAVLAMGEGEERTPAALIRGAPHLHFSGSARYESVLAPVETDIFGPLFKDFQEKRS